MGALAGVVDDEGIELGNWAEGDFGIAVLRQGHGFTRQPFEITVLAIVDDGLRFEVVAQPEIGGEIEMRRNKCRIVVGRFRIDAVAARRLDGDSDVAVDDDGEMESAVGEMRIRFRLAPLRGDLCTDDFGEGDKMLFVSIEREARDLIPPFGGPSPEEKGFGRD